LACGHCLQSWEIIKNHGPSMHRPGCLRRKKLPKMQVDKCRDNCIKCKQVFPLDEGKLSLKEMENAFIV